MPNQHAVFCLYPGALLTGVSGPMEMLVAANRLARIHRLKQPPWTISTIATDPSVPVTGSGGMQVVADAGPERCAEADIIFVPPLWGNPMPVVRSQGCLAGWIEKGYLAGAQVVATGTGVCLLAEQGMLTGRPATTHWYFFDRFKKLYPQVSLNEHQFLTHSEGIYCAGSINTLTDFVIHLIRGHFGVEISRVVEQHFSHEINRTFEAQFLSSEGLFHQDEDIAIAQSWVNQNWQQTVSLADWAAQAGMSVRTFSRRFHSAVGMTPVRFLQELRIRKATEILRDSNLPVSAVGELVGYRDHGHFITLFRKIAGVAPGEYRKIVRSKLFNAGDVPS